MHLIIYAPTPVKPSDQSLFYPNNRWIIAQIVLSKADLETEVGLIIVLRQHTVHELRSAPRKLPNSVK